MSTSSCRIDLFAADLFGNDAAEDEKADVFDAYALQRPESVTFLDPANQILVARAYKGEGKSALLRFVRSRLQQQANAPLIVELRGKQLSPVEGGTDTDAWARAWKAALLRAVACEIGVQINVAWTDTDMSLVEEAERGGYRSRNLVSAVWDRLKIKDAPIERVRPEVVDHEGLVKRWASRSDSIWVFVDDIDENFTNTPQHKAKVAAFFIAAREVMLVIPHIRFRLAVRPNVWTTLSHEYESLTKVAQYCVDLRWSVEDIRELLAARVRGYLLRQAAKAGGSTAAIRVRNAEALIAEVFETPVYWNKREQPVYAPLATITRRRPRWVIELAREAAKSATRAKRARISFQDVLDCLEPFGKRRIGDTVSEFRSQCPEIEDLISAFSRQTEEYATDELMRTLEHRVLQGVTPRIDGVPGRPRPVDVAAFLFQVGFLTAKRLLPDGEYEHLSYSDQPDLLRTRTNRDDGVRWEIHPVFRQALQLRDATGRPLRKPPNDKRGR